jgi:hypothetical protein
MPRVPQMHVTTRPSDLPRCDCMLVYLNDLTWTSGEESARFGHEVERAMRAGLPLVLAHEQPGLGQEARHGCEFGQFFGCERGTTPAALLQLGIYQKIAIALKGGEWRKASMVILVVTYGL